MRPLFLVMILLQAISCAAESEIYIGPHFHYTRVDFNTPTDVEGYMGGVTVGGGYQWCNLFTNVDFEGSWNSGPITGVPCERSSLREYFLEWKAGRDFCQKCFDKVFVFRPYVGFGWDRFINQQNPQGMGLKYEYDKLFVPVGIYAYWLENSCFKCGVQFEWRPDVYSCLRLSSANFNIEWDQAFRAQLPIEMSWAWCCQCFDLKIVPFFDWNRFGRVKDESPNQVMVDIPELTRWNLGLRVLLGYNF